MSFFVAINVISAFLTTTLPLLSVFLIIFLPLTSALVEVMCKDRWFPIYAFATIGLSIVVSLHSIDYTLFYIIPSIFTGYIFGLFAKKNLPAFLSIFIAAVFQMILSFFMIKILEAITGINIVHVIGKIIGISGSFWFQSLFLSALFFIGLVQAVLSFIVVENELSKLGQKIQTVYNYRFYIEIASLVSAFLSVIFIFTFLTIGLLFLSFSFYFCICLIILDVYKKNKICLILYGITIFINICFYQQ